MPSRESRTLTAEEIEEDLQKLDLNIRRLRIAYEQYFGGGLKREPILLRGAVQKLIKRYSDIAMQKYQHRFMFNSLVSRYNVFCEVWGKRLRELEEGPRRTGPGQARARDHLVAAHRFQDADRDHRMLRQLHAEFLQARRRSGGTRTNLSFEKFVQGVSAQVDQLKKRTGCGQVELRLVVSADHKVQLKARPDGRKR
jgi:hypothetical protein